MFTVSPVFNGGGKSLIQAQNKIWAIFDGRTSTSEDGTLPDGQVGTEYDSKYQSTWKGVRSTDFDNSKADGTNHSFTGVDHLYRNTSDINGNINVNGKTLFSGLGFTAKVTSDPEAYIDISLSEYRIYMSPKATFTLQNITIGNYIWIEAITASDKDLKFSLTANGTTGTSADRLDRTDKSAVSGKHIFCYQAKDDKYVISAIDGDNKANSCYLYMVAIMDHPIPDLSVSTSGGTTSTTAYVGGERITNISGNVTYSSDDETVVKVDQAKGTITEIGPGTANITATLKEGVSYSYGDYPWNRQSFTLDYPCSASVPYTVNNTSLLSTKDLSTSPNPWTEIPFYNRYSQSVSNIKLYIGGWKYQNNTALADKYTGKNLTGSYKTLNGRTATDSWESPKDYSVGKELPIDYRPVAIDGYGIYTLGKENAKNEFVYTDVKQLLAGDYVLDFKERTPGLNADDITSKEEKQNNENIVQGRGNPFTVPCFGSFVKIEPECNGTVTVYIMQNGNLEFDSDHNNHLIGLLGWRPVFIVDEAGNRLSEDEDKGNVKAITKQRTMVSSTDRTSDVYESPKSTEPMKDENGNLVTYIDAIQNYIDENTQEPIYWRHKSIFDTYWGRRGTAEKILPPSKTGDGWIAMTKGYVKYQFNVKAGKSYYLFANKSAIGFCGATFLPDAAPSGSATLDENSIEDEVAKILGNNESVTLGSVTVNHKFHAGWNSICLPFSISESKMREIFGSITTTSGRTTTTTTAENYEVVMYNGSTETGLTGDNGVKYDKVHFFHHVYQDIIAGYPYMIYIPAGNDIVGKESFEVKNVTIEKVDRPTITRSSQYMPEGSGFENHRDKDDGEINEDFTFKGVYMKTPVARGSYLVVAGGISLYDAVTMPGYRAYLHPSYKDKAATEEVKRISVTNLDDVTSAWDEATPIKSILANEMPENTFVAPSDVYSVSGQLVRKGSTSLDGLPKGVYIVNGKKCLVK